MKRIFLLLLGFLFLTLWITGLFYTNLITGIHTALIIALPFFMRSLMIPEPPVTTKPQEQEYEVDTPKPAAKKISCSLSKQEPLSV